MYRPALVSVPIAGFNVHVTDVFVVPFTVAENCWLLEAYKLALAGLTATETPTLTTPFVVLIDPPSPFKSASTGFDN